MGKQSTRENKTIYQLCREAAGLTRAEASEKEGTVLNFSLTFDISWKVMKDILIKKMGILDFAVGSPRETLQQAFTNGIIDDDTWLQMLKSRNHLSHDYDGTFAAEKFQDIINIYYPLFEKFKNDVAKYYKQ